MENADMLLKVFGPWIKKVFNNCDPSSYNFQEVILTLKCVHVISPRPQHLFNIIIYRR